MATKLFTKWRPGLGERLLKPAEDDKVEGEQDQEEKMDESSTIEVAVPGIEVQAS